MDSMNVYLSGEIHSDWREQIIERCQSLAVTFSGPITDHEASDGCGEVILGTEVDSFWKDHKAAKINAIRIRASIEKADVVVVRFGEKYRQWNAAFDAGYAAALGKSIITLHDEPLTHALKEVNAVAMASCKTAKQVAEVLTYVLAN